jgi:hypothetical protein
MLVVRYTIMTRLHSQNYSHFSHFILIADEGKYLRKQNFYARRLEFLMTKFSNLAIVPAWDKTNFPDIPNERINE